jgi:sugar lactone lactonase YvrE
MRPGRLLGAVLGVIALSLPGCGLSALIGIGTASLLDRGSNRTQAIPIPVAVTTPAALTWDRVPIGYALEGSSTTRFDVTVEYSLTGSGGPFLPATEALGAPSQGTKGLSASPSGDAHLFVWNSFADLDRRGVSSAPSVVVRVSAFAPGTSSLPFGMRALTEPFAVDNRLVATVAGPPTAGGEGIPAADVPLVGPDAAIVVSGMSILIADTASARVRRLDFTTRLVTTFAGSGVAGSLGDGGPAVAAQLLEPRGLALDSAGDALVCDSGNNRIRRIDALTGLVTTIAGTGSAGYAGDRSPATAALLDAPGGIAIGPGGTIFFTDTGNHAVRTIDSQGTIETVAGTGTAGTTGDGSAATSAQLSSPHGIAFDPAGAVLVADAGNHAIRRFVPGGALTTIAGTLGSAGLGAEEVAPLAAPLSAPAGVALLGKVVYVSDTGNNRVRAFAFDPASPGAASTIATVAGALDGRAGFAGDNGPATASLLNAPTTLSPDERGGLLVADVLNNRIRRIDGSGSISTVAGSGSPDASNVGDGGPATSARFLEPSQMALAKDGSIYVADGSFGNRIRRFSVGGTVATVAGTGDPGFAGDGGPATRALLHDPYGVAIDQNGIIFIGEDVNARVRAINPATGTIHTVLGGGTGPDGVATLTSIGGTQAILSLPGTNQLLVADTRGNAIRRLTYSIDPVSGDVTGGISDTVAGTSGVSGFSGDLGPATGALLSLPIGLDADSNGTIYILDQFAACVRRFQIGGMIATVAGDPTTCGFGGDGGPAALCQLCAYYLVIDRSTDTIYISDFSNNRVRRFQDGGTIDTVGGNGTVGDTGIGGPATGAPIPQTAGILLLADGSLAVSSDATRLVYGFKVGGAIAVLAGEPAEAIVGDGGPAVAAEIDQPMPAVAPDGTLYVAELNFGRLRRVDPLTGIVTRVAGTGVVGATGDGGPLAAALVDQVNGLTVDSHGDILLGQFNQATVRRIDPVAGTIATILGTGPGSSPSGDGGPATQAVLQSVESVAVSPTTGALYVADSFANDVRRVDPQTGIVTTVAGGGTDPGEGVPATQAALANPCALACDANETVYVAQRSPTSTVRKFAVGGTIVTIAGVAGQEGYNGDDIPATSALLDNPQGIGVDAQGDVYVCDSVNNRVRRIDTAGFISTVAGTGEGGSGPDGVPATLTKLDGPRGISLDGHGNIFVGELFGNRVRRFRLFP